MEVSLLLPECELELQATAGAVADIDISAMELYGVLYDCKSKSCAAHLAWASFVNAVESLEQAW